jgi:hypothetical protein
MSIRYVTLFFVGFVLQGRAAFAQHSSDDLKRAFEQMARDQSDAMEWRELVCVPKARVDCGGSSCQPGNPSVHLRLKRQTAGSGTISRCDRTCDTYEASFNTGGIFTSIQPVEPRGFFVKVRGAQEYIEVATQGLAFSIRLANVT